MSQRYIGYLKYTGKLVEDGMLDAKKASRALLGFDQALRYFVVKQQPDLEKISFEIPVKLQTGSWEALIPSNIGEWILTGGALTATAYTSTAFKKMAENDFKNIGFKTIFQKAFKGIQWVIKIGKHLGSISKNKIEKIKFGQDNSTVGIPNDRGEYLYVPKEYLDWYFDCPPKLLSDLAKLIESERELKIAVNENEKFNEVTITIKEKYFFTSEEDMSDSIFPDLTHGKHVELEGEVTRGNEITNTIGFKYKEHILSCSPKDGSIVDHKQALFRKCKIIGIIDRSDDVGAFSAKKPKIIFIKIIPMDKQEKGPTLF